VSVDQPRRLFRYSAASALLDELRLIVRAMQGAKRAAEQAQQQLQRIAPAMRGNGHALQAQALERDIETAVNELRARLDELQRIGVELKDIDQGLLDFPCLHEGRVVDLCWMVSEPAIAHWHERDAGFAGRQRLERPTDDEWSDGTL
jgi:hypothetical protein